tara:strand:+ start:51 stop:608 length:558 start_codon:yes stop_codon:yes gene_type:complete
MTMTKDILDWCEKYLEPKNKHLGNVPVCPYARAARLQNKYKILEVHNWDSFIDEIIKGVEIAKTPDVQIVIVACNDIRMEPEELAAITHAYNIVFVPQDIYLMCFHPEDEEEDEEVEFLDTGDWAPANEFMMVLIQKFDELEKASDNLRKTGYYDNWPKDYYEGTVLKRQSYRRYRHGKKISRPK